MRGDDVIYPGPARVVLAAASQLREPNLIERHGEEWLANLRHRTRRQQWCDAVSLLVHGARITRWTYDGTYDSQSSVVVVSRMVTAIIMTVGIAFLIAIPESPPSLIGFDSLAEFLHSSVYFRVTDGRHLLLYLVLAAASTLGLALAVRRFRSVVVGGITVGVLATSCTIWFSRFPIVCPKGQRSVFGVCIFDSGNSYIQVFGGLDIVVWGAIAAALVVFTHRKVATAIRVLAATEVVVILGPMSSPSPLGWPNLPYQYADLLGLVDLVQFLPDLLSSITFGAITTVQVTPGLALLFSGIAVRLVMQCATIARSLNRSTRGVLAGAWACL